MIKYAAYLPTDLLETVSDLMDFHFLEPNVDPRYIGFYIGLKDKLKMLDNGLIEFQGTSWSVDKLVPYALDVNANIVVCPDKLGNWQHNLDNMYIMRRLWSRLGVVLAGPNWQEQADQVATSIQICLPYRLNRIPVKAYEVHLLGFRLPEHYTPFKAMAQSLSLDTVEPISASYRNWNYSESGFASFPRPKGYEKLTRSVFSIELLKENILWFKNYLNTKE